MESPADQFDLIVLGGGTGGYTAAFRASQLGLRTALVEADLIGGTCLHRGCIPTKVMLESADLLARMRDASAFGLEAAGVGANMAAIARRRTDTVNRLTGGLMSLVRKNRVELIHGRGVLGSSRVVRVALAGPDGLAEGERVIQATNLILATGSRPRSLPGLVPDGRRIVTSDDVLTSEVIPPSLIVVGGGAVGVEFASFYRDMGTEVTLVEYLPSLAPLEDAEIGRVLERAFRRRGIEVIVGARLDPETAVADDAGVTVSVETVAGVGRRELHAAQLLVATGRSANVSGIGLENTQVVVESGVIRVDPYMRTAEPNVYAIGDLVGGLLLAHVAAHEGIVAVETIAGLDPEPVDYSIMPRATYCRPQIASVGRSEAELTRDSVPYVAGKFPWLANAKAVIGGDHEGFAKVLAHAETGQILGIHLIGPHVTDLVAEGSLGMNLAARVQELAHTVHPHPSLSEALAEAAMAVSGQSINV